MKTFSNIPLLITSSIIVSDPLKKITDIDQRINATISGIREWLKLVPDLKIVICDGSNFDLSKTIQQEFPIHEIECLFFKNNQEAVQIHGGGWGEGEIIKFALQNSNTLRNCREFMKCTSKLWVKNIAQCMRYWNGEFICNGHFSFRSKKMSLQKKSLSFFSEMMHFLKRRNRRRLYNKIRIDSIGASNINFDAIDTRFYVINKDFYLRNFIDAYLTVSNQNNYYLEHAFRDIITSNNINHCIMPVPPEVMGLSGSTGQQYASLMNQDWRLEEIITREIVAQNTPLIA